MRWRFEKYSTPIEDRLDSSAKRGLARALFDNHEIFTENGNVSVKQWHVPDAIPTRSHIIAHLTSTNIHELKPIQH
jgi:hypothetical protein